MALLEPPDPDDYNTPEGYQKAFNSYLKHSLYRLEKKQEWGEQDFEDLEEILTELDSSTAEFVKGESLLRRKINQKNQEICQIAEALPNNPPNSQTVICLTVKQPWAWAIFHAGKNIENRVWKTDYRGDLYIHAGKNYDLEGKKWIENYLGVAIPADLETGVILGKVDLSGISKEFGSPWAIWSQYNWEINSPLLLESPIPAKGSPSLWKLEIPSDNLNFVSPPQKNLSQISTRPSKNSKVGRPKGSKNKQKSRGSFYMRGVSKKGVEQWSYHYHLLLPNGRIKKSSVSVPLSKLQAAKDVARLGGVEEVLRFLKGKNS